MTSVTQSLLKVIRAPGGSKLPLLRQTPLEQMNKVVRQGPEENECEQRSACEHLVNPN